MDGDWKAMARQNQRTTEKPSDITYRNVTVEQSIVDSVRKTRDSCKQEYWLWLDKHWIEGSH